jgi:hypothetical protein
MRERTLVTHKLYFGMSALYLRTATTRVLARLAGIPPASARVSTRNLRQDFGMNTVEGQVLVEGFVANGLLEPRTEQRGEYRLTERFVEFATARVVEPLPRSRAKELLAQCCELATRINAECTRNPLEIELIAPFGRYIALDEQLSALELGIVVAPRAPSRRARWGRFITKSDGARDIRAAFRDLSSFIRVRMVNDKAMLPRPFTVVFEERQ